MAQDYCEIFPGEIKLKRSTLIVMNSCDSECPVCAGDNPLVSILCKLPHSFVPRTLFALCSELVDGCMRMMTSFYQDLSFCDFCSFVTFFEANVRLSISPSALSREFHVRLKKAESL